MEWLATVAGWLRDQLKGSAWLDPIQPAIERIPDWALVATGPLFLIAAGLLAVWFWPGKKGPTPPQVSEADVSRGYRAKTHDEGVFSGAALAAGVMVIFASGSFEWLAWAALQDALRRRNFKMLSSAALTGYEVLKTVFDDQNRRDKFPLTLPAQIAAAARLPAKKREQIYEICRETIPMKRAEEPEEQEALARIRALLKLPASPPAFDDTLVCFNGPDRKTYLQAILSANWLIMSADRALDDAELVMLFGPLEAVSGADKSVPRSTFAEAIKAAHELPEHDHYHSLQRLCRFPLEVRTSLAVMIAKMTAADGRIDELEVDVAFNILVALGLEDYIPAERFSEMLKEALETRPQGALPEEIASLASLRDELNGKLKVRAVLESAPDQPFNNSLSEKMGAAFEKVRRVQSEGGNEEVLGAAVKDAFNEIGSALEEWGEPGSTEAEPLVKAADAGDIGRVRELLDAGKDPNGMNEEESWPLLAASEAGHLEVVNMLLGAGANPDRHATYHGVTALLAAAEEGHEEIVSALLSGGANPNLLLDQINSFPLCAAVATRRPEIVQQLLRGGADPNLIHRQGPLFALLVAARSGYADMVDLLLGAGADPVPWEGEPSTWPRLSRKTKLAAEEALSKAGFDSSFIENQEYNWPLMIAAVMGHMDIVGRLAKSGT